MTVLGKLIREKQLQKIWPDEARDFTPWLAKEENLAFLSEHIGLGSEGLELQAVEHWVGPYRADILCRRTDDNSLVLIENQLRPSDHSHLGQIITYAAGIGATTIIWIASRFTDEHRRALEWLNEMASEQSFNFFASEIELWKIDDGLLAPKFNSVVRPNDWLAEVQRQSKATGEMTPTKELQRDFWSEFGNMLEVSNTPVRRVKPLAQHWLSHGIGKTNVQLTTVMHLKENWIRIEIYLTGSTANDYYQLLLTQKPEIEDEIGDTLGWYDEARNDRRIYLRREFPNVSDRATWPEQHKWLVEKAALFHEVFHDRVRSFDPDIARIL